MTRFALILLASCVPLQTSTTTSPTPTGAGAPPPARGTGQQSGTLDERAAMYEREAPPATSHEQPGVPLDTTPRPCIAAQNHCMRGGWFLSQGAASQAPEPAVPAYATSETSWLDYRNTQVIGDSELGQAMRTAPATLQAIRWHRPIIAFCPRGAWPASEAEMLTSRDWYLVVVDSVDEAAGTITIPVDQRRLCPPAIPIANLRVIVEQRVLQ